MLAYQTNQMYETKHVRETKALTPNVCLICREEVTLIAAENAATICQCSRRKIYRWIEDGDLHFLETLSGEVLVCGKSLSKKMEELDSNTDPLKTV